MKIVNENYQFKDSLCKIRVLDSTGDELEERESVGFLITSTGAILTCGHVFWSEDKLFKPDDKYKGSLSLEQDTLKDLEVIIKFEESEEIKGNLIRAKYNNKYWLDYAVIEVEKSYIDDIPIMPICYAHECRYYNRYVGSGEAHNNVIVDRPTIGETAYTIDKNGGQFYLYNADDLRKGFSGSVLYNEYLNAAIGIHIAMAALEDAENARYAMPLVCIKEDWPDFTNKYKDELLIVDFGEPGILTSSVKYYPNSFFSKGLVVYKDRLLVISANLHCEKYGYMTQDCNLFKENVLSQIIRDIFSMNAVLKQKFFFQFSGCSLNLIADRTNLSMEKDFILDTIEFLTELTDLDRPATKTYLRTLCNKCGMKKNKENLRHRMIVGVTTGGGYFNGSSYFGRVIEEARHLMEYAWPHGVVIKSELFGNIKLESILEEIDNNDFVKDEVSISNTKDGKKIECHSTSSVVNWKCIAWPGFEHIPFHNSELTTLNSMGVTFLTHEGLQGNFKTIQLWAKGTNLEKGDYFDFIIDDYDSISMKVLQNEITVKTNRNLPNSNILADGLKTLPWKTGYQNKENKPYFVPLRCGLNGLLCKKELSDKLKSLNSYSDVFKYCNDPDNDITIAIFDNFGSFMPILISIFLKLFTKKKITENNLYCISQKDLQKIINWLNDEQMILQKHSNKRTRLFTLYKNIDILRSAVMNEENVICFGGGTWIFDNNTVDSNSVSFIPSLEKGFVWIEGGVFNAETKRRDILEKFVNDNMLSPDFQKNLNKKSISNYISYPVINEAIMDIKENSENLSSFYYSDLTRMFRFFNNARGYKSVALNKENVIIRQSPKYIEEWQIIWQHIRTKFSEKG